MKIQNHVIVLSLAAFGCVTGRGPSTADEHPPGAQGDRSTLRSEAELNLKAIELSAKTTFIEKGTFPIGAQELTPAESCCADGREACVGDAADWNGVAMWDELDFEILQNHYFRYSYESDGQTYEARAVGDPDCDGEEETYVKRGRIENGTAVADLITPADAQ